MSSTFKFRIQLDGSHPPISREFLVPSDFTFYKLHHTVQIVMGWENYHLYEFSIDSYRIGQQFEEDGFNGPNEIIDSKTLKIGDVLKYKSQKLDYLYDFGDYWQHSLTLERIVEDLTVPFPICCSGNLNCPPEDIGGLPGFYDFLKIINKPKHPEYKELQKWVQSKLVSVGSKYEPMKFYSERVNFILLNLDKYIMDWENESD
ncbi:plasmid pRiA4b ORF-3 family protein [Arenibacter aquaticus]|uniref:Plasmid pRiA4b ORF-3 family protein n=1 Tax=Arenibacter aquaticus TaxID=2489054 RepID=A0A3S0AM64_9FLAO|nr:plasmid pRiA4b ORF-3 family protein [Arenibacter aquaticus]RTE53267.1 plasmid pRiA4b ORF-3 family protein [Arenibacter aquaticus]